MGDAPDGVVKALAELYRLERELGSGGMATVYLAHDLKHDRRVALKVLNPDLTPTIGRERFLREIRVTAQLDHPHVVPLLDSGDAYGVLYYVMPYVEGESLRDLLTREKQLPLDDALRIAREVADALSYAHSHGVIHRDVKPENILLAGGHARVADFGIARAFTMAGGERLTATGLAIGTPAYMSPEQASGGPEIDGRSDVYALGCVLYELLAGHPPFTGGTAQEVLARHFMDAVPSLKAARPAVPEELERVIATSLAKSPADRFKTAAELRAHLEGQRAAPTHPLPAPRRLRITRKIFLPVLAAVGLIAIALSFSPDRQVPVTGPVTGPVHARTSVAVLPFRMVNAETPHASFAAGLHDELLTQLSKVAALTVISRTSVTSYAGPDVPPLRQVASELRVGSVVEGSVQVLGERLRVNVRLIDAATDAPIWSQRYDRTMDDAFAIQSDVAHQIVAAVGAALTNAERLSLARAPTANAEAFLLYVQGREYVTRAGQARHNYETAQPLFERALDLDSTFALARAALSEVHGAMHWFRYDPSPMRVTRQREEAEAALRLEPNLPQAHVAMGLVHFWGRRDYRRALVEFAVGLEGLPNDAYLWRRIGAVHRRLGNWDKVIEAFEKAAQLDPRDADLFSTLGAVTYQTMRRYAEAVQADDRALSLAPDMHLAAVQKGRTYLLWQGQLDTLRAVLSRLPTDADLGFLGTKTSQHLELLFWDRQADSLLRALERRGDTVFQGQNFVRPAALYAAWAHQQRGDSGAARAAFGSARSILDSLLRELPGDWRVHAARGLVLAGLGASSEALHEARWLEQSTVYRTDAIQGPQVAEDRARILSQAGDRDGALQEINRLLSKPSSVSVHKLRLEPLWDPLRRDERFEALLERFAAR